MARPYRITAAGASGFGPGPRKGARRGREQHCPPQSAGLEYPQPMQVSENIQCPFCGQSFELVIDTSVESQRFTTDCEVCCRPFEVSAECEPGEVLSLDVQAG